MNLNGHRTFALRKTIKTLKTESNDNRVFKDGLAQFVAARQKTKNKWHLRLQRYEETRIRKHGNLLLRQPLRYHPKNAFLYRNEFWWTKWPSCKIWILNQNVSRIVTESKTIFFKWFAYSGMFFQVSFSICRAADILENVENFRNFQISTSSENSRILKEFWPNFDVKSSNGSIPRRSKLSL